MCHAGLFARLTMVEKNWRQLPMVVRREGVYVLLGFVIPLNYHLYNNYSFVTVWSLR